MIDCRIARIEVRLSPRKVNLVHMACDSALSWMPEAASLVAEGPLRLPRLNTKRPSAATKKEHDGEAAPDGDPNSLAQIETRRC